VLVIVILATPGLFKTDTATLPVVRKEEVEGENLTP
jgi:hypothetical protein